VGHLRAIAQLGRGPDEDPYSLRQLSDRQRW